MATSLLIAFSVVLLFVAQSAAICDNGWTRHDEYCYMFSHSKVTWADAQQLCQVFNGYLAEPTNAVIDSFIGGKAMAEKRIYWIGGNDIVEEGNWVWTQTPDGLQYTNWYSLDPNNAGPGEDCLLMNFHGLGQWEDAGCEWQEYFVCQKLDEGEQVIG